MNKSYALSEDDLSRELYGRICLLVSGNRGGWESFGAAFGLAGGVLSAPSGALLWAAAQFPALAGTGPALSVLSNVLFGLCLPLLALGACCLDLLEKKSPLLASAAEARRAAHDRPHLFTPRLPQHN